MGLGLTSHALLQTHLVNKTLNVHGLDGNTGLVRMYEFEASTAEDAARWLQTIEYTIAAGRSATCGDKDGARACHITRAPSTPTCSRGGLMDDVSRPLLAPPRSLEMKSWTLGWWCVGERVRSGTSRVCADESDCTTAVGKGGWWAGGWRCQQKQAGERERR